MNEILLSPFRLHPSWEKVLGDELSKPYMLQLATFLEQERRTKHIYPPEDLLFEAFRRTPYEKVRVVIVGQDPYHGAGQAHGLSFSVPHGVPQPPSLVNIFKELKEDLGVEAASHGSLLQWADQGVLLLNASLSVESGKPMSHQGKGWEHFTDRVVEELAKREGPIVFILWGRFAQEKCQKALNKHVPRGTNRLVLTSAHPSPLSCHQGFFGSKPFSKTNKFLREKGLEEINWKLS